MKRTYIVVIITACLAGCYMPNRERLEKSANEAITIGMPLPQAIARLKQMKLACSGTVPASDHRLTCARVRQRLWPSSCIERVILTVSPIDGSVQAIEVPPILCAGL
jgi:hypothetical protein